MDKLTAERRSENMRRIKSKNTKPEMLVRKLVFGMGFRYRLHSNDLPGKPDLVFRKKRKVIFVHGCFWHSHERAECRDAGRPKSNQAYWNEKLDRNKQRDVQRIASLQERGWSVLVLWDCELNETPSLKIRIREFLKA